MLRNENGDARSATPARRRRAYLVAGLCSIAVLVAVAVVTTRPVPEEPVAAADPTPPPSLAPVQTAIVTTEAPTTTEPPETVPEATSTTLPAPKPGPPVWPSTGAQAQHGKSITVYDAMNGRIVRTLADPWGAIPSHPSFRVIEDKGSWLHVSLPFRPNESTGWIKKDDINLYTTNISVDVDLNAHWMTVYDKDQTIISNAIVVGTDATPTPPGNFFVTDLIPNPGGPYGTYAYGLSARSNVLTEFGGGDGQVAIHGTNQPQLMGTAASHGCVRVTNEIANRLGKVAMVGIPVRLHQG